MSEVFQKSLDIGVVPNAWRQAHINLINKKGDKSLIYNYRPVNLTAVIG